MNEITVETSTEPMQNEITLEQLHTELNQLKEDNKYKSDLLKEAEILLMEDMGRGNSSEINLKDYRTVNALSTMYTNVSNQKRSIIQAIDMISNNYIVHAILSQFVDDAFSPDIHTGNVVNIFSKNAIINKEIKYLDKQFKFDKMAMEIAFDILRYGDFILKTKVVPGQGLVDLLDNIDQARILAITKYGDITNYLVQAPWDTQKGLGSNHIELKGPSDYVSFMLGQQRIRVDLIGEFDKVPRDSDTMKTLETLPRYVRIGRSIIYPVISKLRELELLEALIPATNISKVTQGSILAVQVAPGTPVLDAIKACRSVENAVNMKVGINTDDGELTVANIMSSAGKIKAIPQFGDKGAISKVDYKPTDADGLLDNIRDLREVICTSMGYPVELLFKSDEKENRGSLLKRYARYLRVLKSVQIGLIEGFKQMIKIHLVNKFNTNNTKLLTDLDKEIEIDFTNKLLNIDNTDALEFLDMSIGMLTNVTQFIDTLQIQLGPEAVNLEVLGNYLNSNLGTAGLKNLINVKKIQNQVMLQAEPDKNQDDKLNKEPLEDPVKNNKEE
jgi:hypothetical protein